MNRLVFFTALISIGFAVGCSNDDGTETTTGAGAGGGETTTANDGPKPIHLVAFDEHDETLQAIIDG